MLWAAIASHRTNSTDDHHSRAALASADTSAASNSGITADFSQSSAVSEHDSFERRQKSETRLASVTLKDVTHVPDSEQAPISDHTVAVAANVIATQHHSHAQHRSPEYVFGHESGTYGTSDSAPQGVSARNSGLNGLQPSVSKNGSGQPGLLSQRGQDSADVNQFSGHSYSLSQTGTILPENHDTDDAELFAPPQAKLPPTEQDSQAHSEIGRAGGHSIDAGDAEDRTQDDLWWETGLASSVLPGRSSYPLTLERALGLAISEAPELQVLHSDWYIQQTEEERLAANFDWTTFVDAVWNRDSTPVGSDLDGSARRLRRRSLASSAGIRRLTRDGSEFQLSQDFGTLNSNSRFINPNNQGTSRLSLEYERPLLQGAGEDVATSQQQLATINKGTAFDRFQIGVQDHLLQVASAYWSLVLRRGRFLQVVKSWERAKAISEEMENRVEIDVTPGMLHRAKSAVAMRLSDSIEAEHDVVRSQDALLRLIYGARFTDFADYEVVTTSLPMRQGQSVQLQPQIERALRDRSEIHQAIRDIKAASVRYNLAENQVLPVLNMVLTGYVAGLRGNNDLGGSFVNQFSEGEPGLGIGFNFEIPYRNRAAVALKEQGQIAIKRMQAQLQASIGLVSEDVRNQLIQRNKYGKVLVQQSEALDRINQILAYTQKRRELLADGVDVADLYLENLLQMQSRVENAEYTYLSSQIRYTLSDNALLRALSALDSIADRTQSAAVIQKCCGEAVSPSVPSHTLREAVSSGHDF